MSAAAPPPADDAGWVRVHPASPWVRGWTFLLLILFFAGRNAVEDFAAGRLSGEDAPGGGDGSLLVAGGILLGVTLLISLVFFFSWWFTRFRCGEDRIELRQGGSSAAGGRCATTAYRRWTCSTPSWPGCSGWPR